MKMPEKTQPVGRHSRSKGTNIRAILAFAMAYLRGRYNGGAFTKTLIGWRCARRYHWFIRVTFSKHGLSSNLAYITTCLSATSVLTRLVRLSNASLLKKPEQKMVEINNQRKAFLDILAWSEELITDVRKPEIMVMTSLQSGGITNDYSSHPRKLVTLNPKLKSTGAGHYQLLSRWWDACRKQLGLKDFSESRDAMLSRLRSVALYL